MNSPNNNSVWITLGTAGGPEIHPTQSQIANALVVAGRVYLFDLGNGVLRQLESAGYSARDVRGVFLTHHHRDHNSDLGPVMLSNWQFSRENPPMPICGPKGTRVLSEGLASANAPTVAPEALAVNSPRGPSLSESIGVVELAGRMDSPVLTYEDAFIKVTAISVDHFHAPPSALIQDLPEAIAYRIEAAGRTYVYSGDTGPSDNLAALATEADLLITEVVDLDAIRESLIKRNPNASAEFIDARLANMAVAHLTGEEIGKIAAKARVGQVILTHYVPSFEDQPDVEKFGRGIAPTYGGPVSYAQDLDRF